MKRSYTAIIITVWAIIIAIGTGANTVEVTLTQAGTLSTAVGEAGSQVDTLIVKGPVDDVDFRTMWDYSFHGKLEMLDLSGASVEGGKVPDHAFCHIAEQSRLGSIYFPNLKTVILPDNVSEIGKWAFSLNRDLASINIPKGLRKLGDGAFYNCDRLRMDKMVIPEGVTEIPSGCFDLCKSLRCEVVLSSTLETIGIHAFESSYITKVNFPENLKKIGDNAFYNAMIEEAILPDGCNEIGMGAFSLNLNLSRIKVPASLKVIPMYFAYMDTAIAELTLPSTVEEIGWRAFYSCKGLLSLDLPEGVRVIREEAFYECNNIDTVIMPASLDSIKTGSFDCLYGLKAIYSKSVVPPVCYNINGRTPFGTIYTNPTEFSGTPNTVPVYVPKGSKQAYSASPGWKYFKNIVETDSFPSTTGVAEAVAGARPMIAADGGSIVVTLPKGAQAGDVEVYGTDGRFLRRTPVTGQRTVVDMYNAPRGTYIVRAAHAAAKVAL